jgi:hypothetical protein
MEFFTIFLAGLLGIASPTGIILDTIVESKFREQFDEVEQLEVRIDNVPNYRIIQGQVQRVRLASRGVYLTPDFRIDTIELETDALDVDLPTLQQGGREGLNQSLNQPLQGAFRLVITEDDLNNLLRSPQIQEKLPEIINKARGEEDQAPGYELLNPEIDFLEDNRIRIKVQFQRLRGNNPEPLDIVLEMGFESENGKNIKIVNFTGTLNERELSQRLLEGFAEGITDRLDLSILEERGLLARLLQLQITNDNLNVAGFLRLEGDKENNP